MASKTGLFSVVNLNSGNCGNRIYRDVTNARVSSPHLALVDDRDQRRLDDTPAPSFLRIDSTRIFW